MGHSNTMCKKAHSFLSCFLSPIVDLAIRLYLGFYVFGRSGWGKFQDYLNGQWDRVVYLYEYEYQVPLFSPQLAACLGTIAEVGFSALLIAGLFTRLGALGLLGMTAVIAFTPQFSTENIYWALLLATIFARGGGVISIDFFIRKFITKTA